MAAKWTTLTGEDKKALLHGGRLVRTKHVFKNSVLHWPYCDGCGLLLLKNEASRAAAKKACVYEDD